MGDHALLGPSSSKRWINCPGSVRATEGIPETYSAYAEEGSLAHDISDLMLQRELGDISPQKLAGQMRAIRKKDWYTPEMEDHCKDYVKYCMQIEADMRFSELRLDLSEYFPESFGTGDFVAVSDEALTVVDLKYGKGVPVVAEGNTQLKSYALGALLNMRGLYDPSRVDVHIYQPRIDNITTVSYTPMELLDWAADVAPQAQKAFDGVDEFKSGDWCKWCKMAGNCSVRAAEQVQGVFDLMVDEPGDVRELKPNEMSDEEISYWLQYADVVTKWFTALKKFAEKEAIAGHHYPGFKVVEGKSDRVYSDADQIQEVLKGAGVSGFMTNPKPELLGITAMTKLLGKKEFNALLGDFLIKPPGKPTIVPDTDKRPALENAKDVFKDE